ncbi:uncharacterized protein LOC132088221 [Daphnia carinata]|uniref:uncharacterized protein LOC132088221 n=1 Tax=Daphnia carinata TaxID=120202 RepID=UPI00286905EA|nr:uncharacterized protein LOC132088221 [Daphnia carinata]
MAKFCFVPLALLMACYAVQVYGAPPDELTVAWENFLAHHPIKGASPQELAKRKGNFAKAHAMIEKHNKNKNATFHMAHNKFSIMDDHEKKKYTGVHLPSHPKDVKYFDANESAVSTRQLPRSESTCLPSCYVMPKSKTQLTFANTFEGFMQLRGA